MSSISNPFTLLKESINPIVAEILEELKVSSHPLIQALDKQPVKGIEVSEAGFMDLYQFKSSPCVVIGDRFAYKTGVRDLETGRIKFKKFTLQVKLTEDEMDRVESIGVTALIARNLKNEIKTSVKFLQSKIVKWIIDPFGGVKTDPNYDELYNGLFAVSAAGTLSNPSDLNTAAGTPEDLTAIALAGALQTANNIEALTSAVLIGMTKIDAITESEIPINTIYMGVHPYVMKVLTAKSDILNTTSQVRSGRTYKEDLIARGIIPIESVSFDPDYVYTDGTPTTIVFFADPMVNFSFLTVVPPKGEGWSAWDKEKNTEGELTTISYEKHKKIEIGCLPQAYWVMTSSTAGSMFSVKWFATITPLDDT